MCVTRTGCVLGAVACVELRAAPCASIDAAVRTWTLDGVNDPHPAVKWATRSTGIYCAHGMHGKPDMMRRATACVLTACIAYTHPCVSLRAQVRRLAPPALMSSTVS